MLKLRIFRNFNKFRYFSNENIDKVEIKIYSTSGFLVESISSTNIQVDEYNEIEWVVGDAPKGLYLANLVSYFDSNQRDSKITKVLITSKK